jgi:hypothetical protein
MSTIVDGLARPGWRRQRQIRGGRERSHHHPCGRPRREFPRTYGRCRRAKKRRLVPREPTGPCKCLKTKKGSWRRGWDSNPRAGYPTSRFRGGPVTTTSVPLRTDGLGPVGNRCRALLSHAAGGRSAAGLEETLQNVAAFVREDARDHVDAMVQRRMIQGRDRR